MKPFRLSYDSIHKAGRNRLALLRLALIAIVLPILLFSGCEKLSSLLPSSEKKPESVLITATGDVLLEDPILNYFNNGDWKNYMDRLKPYFQQDDLTIANQEVPIGGEELGITGIDFSFNAPTITAQNLADSGIDFVSLANNHAMDRGMQGIINTHQALDAAGIGYTGTAAGEEESRSIALQEINGIKIAIVSYTYNCNQPVTPEWAVNTYYSAYDDRSDAMIEDLQKARTMADAVILCIHWGTEFTYAINSDQSAMSENLIEAGADVIIGNHPHTIQPAQWIETPSGRRGLCFYSLGNLIASAYQVDRASEQFQNMYEVGALAQFRLTKTEDGIEVQDPRLIPFVNHFEGDYASFELIPLSEYTEELAARHDQRRYSDLFTAAYLKEQVHSVFEPGGIPFEQNPAE